MPPSGYSTEQSRHMTDLLRSCACALVDEARENGWTLRTALDIELRNICAYLDQEETSPAQRAILAMTEAFYQKLKVCGPNDKKSFWAAADMVLAELQNEVLAIKVPTTA
jgi:hypothetical protein